MPPQPRSPVQATGDDEFFTFVQKDGSTSQAVIPRDAETKAADAKIRARHQQRRRRCADRPTVR